MDQLENVETLSSTESISKLIDKEILSLESKPKSIPAPNEDNWKDVLALLKIDQSKDYPEPPICISVNGESGPRRFGSLGNFSLVTGKAKSRKTYFISYILSQALKNTGGCNEKITVKLKEGHNRITLFDTEQSSYDVHNVTKRILNGAVALSSNLLDVYPLRAFTSKERVLLIDNYINNTPDLGIVVIDGIRDLITDINSPEQAGEINRQLLKWTEERNIHIITVLHQNKGENNNARGHIGTELTNKAETVVNIELKDNLSVISPGDLRGKPFDPFPIGINSMDVPYVVHGWENTPSQQIKTNNNKNPIAQSKEWHKELLGKIFDKTDQYQRNELSIKLKAELNQISFNNGDTAVRTLIQFYINKSYLVKEAVKGNIYPVYKLFPLS